MTVNEKKPRPRAIVGATAAIAVLAALNFLVLPTLPLTKDGVQALKLERCASDYAARLMGAGTKVSTRTVTVIQEVCGRAFHEDATAAAGRSFNFGGEK